ncbi:MAG: SigB/SigF/SigG family RNA polymerase sigma factor [Actinomycetota bacterium]|jgi:RNA polymerase sigma-B factor|nr:SigB/SigF/SigG family RNA polymerase sigma factor [Actinomycetota bacterium]
MASTGPTPSTRAQMRRDIAQYHRSRSPETRERIVGAYQGLAYSLAARFAQRGEELDDLNQVALIGLLKAVDRFDPDRGAELTTFATATILGELKRHLRDRGWSVRLPRRIHDLHLGAQQCIDELTQEYGRSPTLAEIADRLDVPIDDVVEALDAGGLRHNASLEAPSVGSEERTLTSRLGERDPRLAEIDGKLELSPLLARLPDRQRHILELRFVVGCSQTEIASLVGISQMQVSRLLARSLDQLRSWATEPA